MAIKSILFNTDMVRAIMDGRKSCTRRMVKPQPDEKHIYPLGFVTDSTEKKEVGCFGFGINEYGGSIQYANPQYQPGDLLYVRETFIQAAAHTFWYKADDNSWMPEGLHWKPSIHMPKEAARIWLKVTNVRVERLQEITETQTEEEGFLFTPPCLHRTGENYCDIDGPCGSKIKYCDMSAGELFGKVLWNSTIKKPDIDIYGWYANPWVWVIEFERCEKPKEV